jgi:TRAP-type C4-dicarboxylate transport system permease small subunit
MASTFGTINSPLSGYGSVNTGLPQFITNIVTVIFAAAGLFAFFNLMFAGFTYITSNGDQKKLEQAISSINMSLMGLVVMVAAAAVTGIVSYLLFGSATAILSPSIKGPGSL